MMAYTTYKLNQTVSILRQYEKGVQTGYDRTIVHDKYKVLRTLPRIGA